MEDEPEFQADDGSGIAKPMWVEHDVVRYEDDDRNEEALPPSLDITLFCVKVGIPSVFQNQ